MANNVAKRSGWITFAGVMAVLVGGHNTFGEIDPVEHLLGLGGDGGGVGERGDSADPRSASGRGD